MSKSSAPRLGKGLGALLSHRVTPLGDEAHPVVPPAPAAAHGPDAIRRLPIDRIDPNPRQPRTNFDDDQLQELAASLRTSGVLQPIIVRPKSDGRFEVVAGERRLRAASMVPLAEIPAVVRHVTDSEAVEIALIENLQREDLKPLERARAYEQYLASFGGTPETLADRLGESRSNIANYLRLLRLPDEVRELLDTSQLEMGHARAIAGLSDPHRQVAIARLAVRRNLSVRQVEELARRATAAVPAAEQNLKPPSDDRHRSNVEEALSRAIGLRVRLYPGRKRNSGRVVISYSNLEEFDRIAQALGGSAALE